MSATTWCRPDTARPGQSPSDHCQAHTGCLYQSDRSELSIVPDILVRISEGLSCSDLGGAGRPWGACLSKPCLT